MDHLVSLQQIRAFVHHDGRAGRGRFLNHVRLAVESHVMLIAARCL